ncbi:hypothetical protein AVEN_184979-1, partial [Araneus ventricosus]
MSSRPYFAEKSPTMWAWDRRGSDTSTFVWRRNLSSWMMVIVSNYK